MYSKIIKIKNNSATFYLLLGGILFAAVFYIYCVNSAVHNTVARGQAEDKIEALQAKMSDLEYRYMALENRMTLESASHIGLREPAVKNFISRNSSGELLSLYNRQ